MKTMLLKLATVGGLTLLLAGCNKSNTAGRKDEEPITGRKSDPPVEMKAEWKPDKRYAFHLDLVLNTEMPAGRRGNPNAGPMRQMEITLGQDYSITVTNATTNGVRGLQLEIHSLTMDIASGDTYIMNYDTDNPGAGLSDSPIADQLQKLVGGRIRYLLSPENKVMRMDGFQELMERMGGPGRAVRGQGPPPGMINRIYNPQYFRQLVELTGLPPESVRIGDRWPVKRDLSAVGMGSLAIDLTATFRGWQKHDNRNCALLEFSGSLLPKTEPAPAGPPGTNRTSDVRKLIRAITSPSAAPSNIEKGSVTGKSWFDPSLGFTAETAVDQTLVSKGTTRRTQGTNVVMNVITNTTHQRVWIKLLDVAAIAAP
jgi:hypothetical protein